MEDEKLNKILLTDIKIYIGYSLGIIIISLLSNPNATSIKILFMYFSMLCIGIHVFLRFISMIIFFTNGDSEMGKARLLGIFVVLLIGVPICFSGWIGMSFK